MTKQLSTQEIIRLLQWMRQCPDTFNEAINVGCSFENLDNKWDAAQMADYLISAIEALRMSGTCFLDIMEMHDIDLFKHAKMGLDITNKVLKRE